MAEEEFTVDPEYIQVQFTDNDEVMSFAKNLRAGNSGTDSFNKQVDTLREFDGLSTGMKSKMTRRINKYLKNETDTAGSKQRTREEVSGYGIFEAVAPVYNLDYLARLYEINPVHYAAINAKVSNVISLGYRWEETQATQNKLSDLVATGDEERLSRARRKLDRIRLQLDDWLESLNQEDTWIETLERVYADREIMGQGYLEIGRKSTGEIGYVGHVPAQTIRMRRHRDGFVQVVADKITYFRNFGDRSTPNPIGDDPNPNELLVFRKYSPRSTYYGTPDIISALNAVAGEEFASRFNLDYFEHKAVPRYLIVVKGAKLDAASQKKLLQFFKTNLKGTNHRSVYIPLPPSIGDRKVEFEIVPVENKVQDASFVKYHELNRGAILTAHRVPAGKVAVSGGSSSLGGSRLEEKMFKEEVARPTQINFENRLYPLFKEKTDVYDFRFNELTLTDEETKSKIHERQVRAGILLRNEARQELGHAGIEGGDKMVEAFEKPATGAEQRSQATRGRMREQNDDNGANNSDPGTRNTDGEGTRER